MNLPNRCWVEIEAGALRDNIETLRGFLLPGVRIAPVIKADGYGHGLEAIAQRIADKVDLLGVANFVEALRIRAAAVHLPVMILGPALPEERAAIADHRFIPTVSTAEEATGYAEGTKEPPLPIHFVIDTGMGRIGLWEEEVIDELRLIQAMKKLHVESISTHLPVADEDPVQATPLGHERVRIHLSVLSGEETDQDGLAAEGECLKGSVQRADAADFHDAIDAAAVRELGAARGRSPAQHDLIVRGSVPASRGFADSARAGAAGKQNENQSCKFHKAS